MNKVTPAREAAFRILYKVDEEKAYLNIELNKVLSSGNFTIADRAFITEAVTGTVRHRLLIDRIIGEYSRISFSRISARILNILRLGAYQILFMDRTRDAAACDESVKLALRYGHKASAGFTNAVLRKISEKRGIIAYPDKSVSPAAFLSLKHSHPEWLVKKWIAEFGFDFTESLLEANNKKPPFFIRANRLKADRDGLAGMLLDKGYKTRNGSLAVDALEVEGPACITDLPEYLEGYFHIQDESSMMAAIITDPLPGEYIMDVCAAPGGKTTHIAQLMGNRGKILALDLHDHKLRLIRDAAVREGIGIIETAGFDMTDGHSDKFRDGAKADRVIVDAPCTGYGAIRRKPDIKWSAYPGESEELGKVQSAILDNASSMVRPGGVLVYCTCTVGRDENEKVIEAFLKGHNGFRTSDISAYLPESARQPENRNGILRLFPNTDGTDGFFVTKMYRI